MCVVSGLSHRFALGCIELLLAGSNCTWSHRRPTAIRCGQLQFVAVKCNSTQPSAICCGHVQFDAAKSNSMRPSAIRSGPKCNSMPRSNEEATTFDAKELRRQEHKKWLLYGVAFIVFQTGIMLLDLLHDGHEGPKSQVPGRSATFDTFDIPTTNTSFNLETNFALGSGTPILAPTSTTTAHVFLLRQS
ncbi:hypothetical protein RHMOL_Rhmol09G0259500 [Rhododendron molle]|uniref:Uncharacterized protein n=1 Tax=Rhododendron molle TaxID=49168 RepID=A0ACC0MHC4_RHOML|nr:hypothetical protein RHMOL_Rhmol09G0259500 [Rhododendron molle]